MKKHMGKLLALCLVTVMAAVALTACGGGGSSDSGSGDATAAAGGTLKFGCQNYSAGGLDPAAETNTAWNGMRYGITECLFKFSDSMEVEGWLATDEYEVSDDHKTWTFHIRDDVQFSNGTQMTPSSIAACWDRLFAEGANGTSTPEKFLDADATITPDDENWTLTIETTTAYPDLRKNLAYPVMSIIDVEGTTDFDNGVIGTGPYMVDTYTADVGYTMKANPNYREAVPFETVEIKYLDDSTAKSNALQAGDIDLAENISTKADLENLNANDAYTVNVANGVRCGFSYVNMNGILANDDLRQAVMMAIDNKTIDEVTLGGLYTYGYSVLPSNLEYNYDKLTYDYEFDQAAAIKKLDDAGITDSDGDGIRELDGQPIKIVWVTYENRGLGDITQAAQQQLAEVGIGVDLQVVDSDTSWNRLTQGDYDLLANNWTTVGTGDPTEYLANWYSKTDANYCAYQNDDFDAAYDVLKTDFDEANRLDAITTMQQCLLDDTGVLVHGYYNSSMAFNNSVVGNAPIHTADYYWLTTEITPAA